MVVGLTVSFFVGITVSQERRAAIDDQKARNEFQIHLAKKRLGDRSFSITLDTKSHRLRSDLLKMFQQRLETMNEEELIARKAELQKELGEHDSNAKLQQAKKLLQEILKTYPKSRAAEEARKMLGTRRGSEGGEDAEADPAASLKKVLENLKAEEDALKSKKDQDK